MYTYILPSHKKDMTQGQFQVEFNRFKFSLPSPKFCGQRAMSAALFTHSWRENTWIHTFPKSISAM